MDKSVFCQVAKYMAGESPVVLLQPSLPGYDIGDDHDDKSVSSMLRVNCMIKKSCKQKVNKWMN